MRNLQEATERICELKGGLVALDALLPAVIDTLSAAGLRRLTASFDAHAEVARTLMLNSEMSDLVLAAFEREIARNGALLRRGQLQAADVTEPPGLDPLLLTSTSVCAFIGPTLLYRDTGFFFRRGGQLFLVSTRRALAGHHGTPPPDRVSIQLPADPKGVAWHRLSVPMLRSGRHPLCRTADDVDMAILPLEPHDLPPAALLLAFDESHLETLGETVGVGDPVLTVGYPFGDAAHTPRIPLARSGAIASSFGLFFKDTPSFLTDMHAQFAGAGSAVVRRRSVDRTGRGLGAWQLIGIHGNDAAASSDGSMSGLRRTWYSDILMSLSDDR